MSPSSVVEWLEEAPGPGYLGVLAVAFAEHALFVGTFLPGEVILPLTGVAAATTGVVAWPVAAACASLGGFLADQLTYWLGRWLARRRRGRPAASARAASPARPRSCASCTGATAPRLVLGRFVAGVAPFVAPGAGWAGMPYGRFLPANALANALWGPVMVGVGYLFGIQAARLHGPGAGPASPSPARSSPGCSCGCGRSGPSWPAPPPGDVRDA